MGKLEAVTVHKESNSEQETLLGRIEDVSFACFSDVCASLLKRDQLSYEISGKRQLISIITEYEKSRIQWVSV